MAVQAVLQWVGPTKYTDGRDYTAADHGGYDIELNGQLLASIPFAWNTANTYELDLKPFSQLKQGNNTARIRTVAANGQVSDWTSAVTFPYASVPNAPSSVKVV